MTRSMIIFVLVQQREYDDNVKLQMGTVVGDVWTEALRGTKQLFRLLARRPNTLFGVESSLFPVVAIYVRLL